MPTRIACWDCWPLTARGSCGRCAAESGASEVQLLEIRDEDALRAYMEDPRRIEAKELLGDAEISSRVLQVDDVAI
ncbi:MAG TPA: hypothetical protein VK546_02300 [Gaiellales bacterium]|nr:hypothetical protein [Gaiellales bacterium]